MGGNALTLKRAFLIGSIPRLPIPIVACVRPVWGMIMLLEIPVASKLGIPRYFLPPSLDYISGPIA